jgi:hypothetical protein
MKIMYLMVCIIFLVFGPLSAENAAAIEEAGFTVFYQSDPFEIRRYQPRIVAETYVAGDFDEVGNVGFRRLFDYISGNNRSQAKIEMTSPVTQEPQSEKIEMTAPVTQEKQADRYRITFLMPSRFTMETLPQPLDENVKLKEMPAAWMAAIRYSGTWRRSRYESREKQLLEWVRQQGLKPAGEPVFARYNAPFMPWFLRRNEVLLPIQVPDEKTRAKFRDATGKSTP